jgi:alkylation response protein AidB-like acyl-CoA dehydrogenase
VSAKEGFVAICYERQYGELSRVYAFSKMLLFNGEGRVVGCPTSMTDGCARVLELLGTPHMKETILPRLISREPDYAFTSGQFMTERPGGSDISQTETVATPVHPPKNAHDLSNTKPGSNYRLDGFKWFSSATDSQVSLSLARTGDPKLGSRSLSLFLLPLRLPLPDPQTKTPTDVLPRTNDLIDVDGSGKEERANNNIFIHRLKSKIGTHSLPTAELALEGSLAYLVGPLNEGIKSISTVLQITRLHSAFHSIGSLARCLAIAKAFSKVRRIDGGKRVLEQVPLHVATLTKVTVTYRALLAFGMGTVHLLGQVENPRNPSETSRKTAYEDNEKEVQARFRLLNPTLKAFASYHCVPAMEECMAALGGQGYMEETGLGRLIRDGLVERIWEGTESVMALDLIRATGMTKATGDISRSDNVSLTHWARWASRILQSASSSSSNSSETMLVQAADSIKAIQDIVARMNTIFVETVKNELLPRITLLIFGHTNAALYLLEHAVWAYNNRETDWRIHIDAFIRWVTDGGVAGSSLRGLMEEFDRTARKGKELEDRNWRLVYTSNQHGAESDKAKL